MTPATSSAPSVLRRATALAVAALCPLVGVAACSSGGGGSASDTTVVPGTPPPGTETDTSVPTGGATTVVTRRTTTTSPRATTTTSTTTTTTTTTVPVTTIPHGAGVVATMADGSPVPPAVLSTARAVYDAAVHHDFAALRELSGAGERRFKAGFLGQGNPVAAWQKAVEEGQPDPMGSMARLLETPPGVRSDGSVVYPYLAAKDPATWDDADAAVAATIGFTPEDVVQTKRKGRYLDERMTFAPDGSWTGFAIGG